MKIKYVIDILLTDDRKPTVGNKEAHDRCINEDWVHRRIEIFEKYTLASLKNQMCRDFEIWLRCGKKFEHITTKHYWLDARIKLVSDNHKYNLKEMNDDYLVISRLDSDDMYSVDAMCCIKENAEFTDRLTRMCFHDCYGLDIINGFMYKRFHKHPPMTTHVYPKKLYKDYDFFCSKWFVNHGKLGGDFPDTKDLPKYKVCILKHDLNYSSQVRKGIDSRKGKKPVEIVKEDGIGVTDFIQDKDIISTKIMEEFGVDLWKK